MRKYIVCAIACLNILGIALPAGAMQERIAVTLSTSGVQKTLILPQAADHAPVIYLGTAVDSQSGELVEGYAIIHYKKGEARGGGASKKPRGQCYGFLASGAKWKSVESWIMNPENSRGLDEAIILERMTGGIAQWEDAADGSVDGATLFDILGNGGATTSVLATDSAAPDGQNEVYFGSITNANAIAVTTVWGIFSGPTFQRKLVEWDMVFDEVDFDWSLAGGAGKMDFENIVVHELGHAFGMADLYNASCSEDTMYGYATEGETKKRDLNIGDIQGVSALY